MKKLGLFLAFAAALSLSGAHAQMGITYFPGPGMPHAAAGGCTMNGIFDLTNTCNDIYLLTGVI